MKAVFDYINFSRLLFEVLVWLLGRLKAQIDSQRLLGCCFRPSSSAHSLHQQRSQRSDGHHRHLCFLRPPFLSPCFAPLDAGITWFTSAWWKPGLRACRANTTNRATPSALAFLCFPPQRNPLWPFALCAL